MFCFCVDAQRDLINYLNNIDLLKSSDINFFGPDELKKSLKIIFTRASQYLNAMELCCLGKYIAVEHILGKKDNNPICFYIDGDLFFQSNVKFLVNQIKNYALILTPHYLNSCEKIEIEMETLVSGWINAGFLYRINNPFIRKL